MDRVPDWQIGEAFSDDDFGSLMKDIHVLFETPLCDDIANQLRFIDDMLTNHRHVPCDKEYSLTLERNADCDSDVYIMECLNWTRDTWDAWRSADLQLHKTEKDIVETEDDVRTCDPLPVPQVSVSVHPCDTPSSPCNKLATSTHTTPQSIHSPKHLKTPHLTRSPSTDAISPRKNQPLACHHKLRQLAVRPSSRFSSVQSTPSVPCTQQSPSIRRRRPCALTEEKKLMLNSKGRARRKKLAEALANLRDTIPLGTVKASKIRILTEALKCIRDLVTETEMLKKEKQNLETYNKTLRDRLPTKINDASR